jgi:adenosylmethionine-8-amino-7-oxononanoate aminotransferase
MAHLLNRSLHDRYPHAARAEGVHIFDEAGRRYIDGSSGAGVSCLGHGNGEVLEAMREQGARVTFASSVFFATDIAEELADDLVRHAPAGMARASFGCSGSEQVENAMKLARQYHVDTGKPAKRLIVGRRQSYHGMSIATLNVGGHAQRRELYEPMFAGTYLTEPHFEYRYRRDDEDADGYSRRAADALEETLLALGPENVAAFLCEPVVGATTGCVPGSPVYFERVREICDRHDVLLIFDEIFCGMGRTGTLYACEQDRVVPDMLVLAKGLAGGYQPMSALLINERIYRGVRDGRGYIANGHTYMNHPVGCAAALKVQQILRREGLVERARARGAYLRGCLEKAFADHPHVGDIRGRGLMQALELVEDRESKTPFPPSLNLWSSVMRAALARGLMCYPNQGTADGHRGDHVILAPPYIVSEADCDEMVAILADALDAALPSGATAARARA